MSRNRSASLPVVHVKQSLAASLRPHADSEAKGFSSEGDFSCCRFVMIQSSSLGILLRRAKGPEQLLTRVCWLAGQTFSHSRTAVWTVRQLVRFDRPAKQGRIGYVTIQ